MSKKLKIKKGLTLLELVIVLGLMSIVSMLVFSFTNLTQKKSNELDIKQELQFQGNMVTENFMRYILEAKSIKDVVTKSSEPYKITEISFGVKRSKIAGPPEITDIVSLRYKLNESTGELELFAEQDEDNNETTPEQLHKINSVTTYVKSIEVLNEELKKVINDTKNGVGAAGAGASIKENLAMTRVNNINLKVVLVDEYLGQEIEHEHTIELNLRNA
ncbi:MAG: PulJ/GspJ family protein [Sarcina sp.]